MSVSPSDAMNDALEQCAGLGFEMAPGFSTHWAMGSETLIALGHPELVHDWVALYPTKNVHYPRPDETAPIDPSNERDWRAALGDFDRVSDWAALFERDLAERPWRDVIATWVPRLVPGVGAGLTHGLIRTMHAVRGIDRAPKEPTALHLRELATGMAYWAARYVEQPGPAALLGDARLPGIVSSIPRLDPDHKIGLRNKGFFLHMPDIVGWGEAVSSLASPDDLQEAFSDMTASFAQVQLAHPDVFPIPLVHTVTAPAAMRVMLNYLPEEQHLPAFVAMWQVNAALLTSFVQPVPEEIEPDRDEPALSDRELVERAIEHGDQHVMKLAEASLREHALRPDPRYLLLAERMLQKVPRYYRKGERPAALAR
jgi:Questin oxidase-like